MSYPLAKRLEEWRREDREMNDDPRPGEWQHCWHKSIDEHGICRECGRRAAVKLENLTAGERALLAKHLGEEKPVEKDIRFAVEEFESACDEAIARIGGANAYNILGQRRERADIIAKLQPKEKFEGEKLFTRGVDPEQGGRLEAAARDARERLAEERAREEAERIGSIKALNKEFF